MSVSPKSLLFLLAIYVAYLVYGAKMAHSQMKVIETSYKEMKLDGED